ncbi:MAG: class I SAM-dependent methyltransferase [Velocimicrobium sp.]
MRKWEISKDVLYESDELNHELSVSPWSGHRDFAYDLLKYIRPKRIVELGTHYGCSLFAFLQATKNFTIDTELFAIDTWRGDEQAGFYDDTVWNLVNRTIDEKFKNEKVTLLRKYFNEALNDIDDESVDILHIDGLHTYEAVSEDFHSWLPKLKSNGIVLFHDIASELNYGTNTFWEETRKKYKDYFTFEHSWGLGVLFPKGNLYYEKFVSENFTDKMKVYEYEYLYKLYNIQLNDHINMVNERDIAIKSMEKMINERDIAIKSMEKMINERDKALNATKNMIQEKDVLIKKTEELVNARDQEIIEYRYKNEELSSSLLDAQNQNRELQNEVNKLSEKIRKLLDRNIIQRIKNTYEDVE